MQTCCARAFIVQKEIDEKGESTITITGLEDFAPLEMKEVSDILRHMSYVFSRNNTVVHDLIYNGEMEETNAK